MLADLNRKGSLALPFYPSFIEYDNPASGFADSVSPPRFSTGYFQLRNRFGVLVETHSWKTYPVRVKATARNHPGHAGAGRRARRCLAGAGLGRRPRRAPAGRNSRSRWTYQTGKDPGHLMDFQGYRLYAHAVGGFRHADDPLR